MSDLLQDHHHAKYNDKIFHVKRYNLPYICYYKTDHFYNFRTFSIDLYYCVTQVYLAKIQLSVK